MARLGLVHTLWSFYIALALTDAQFPELADPKDTTGFLNLNGKM